MFLLESLLVVSYFHGFPGIGPKAQGQQCQLHLGTFRNMSLGAGLSCRHLHSLHNALDVISSAGKRKEQKGRKKQEGQGREWGSEAGKGEAGSEKNVDPA